jgi:hypothetical protein
VTENFYLTLNSNLNPMAYKRKGHLTAVVEYCRHLRKYMHRRYWKGERKAAKKLIRKELTDSRKLAA